MRAAVPTEHERARREVVSKRKRLLTERRLLDHGHLRIGQLQPRRLRHDLAAVAPGARDTNHSGPERAAARMALVLGAERDRGLGLAVGAVGAQAGHQRTLWYHMKERSTFIPAPVYSASASSFRPSTPSPARVFPRARSSRNECTSRALPRPRRRHGLRTPRMLTQPTLMSPP